MGGGEVRSPEGGGSAHAATRGGDRRGGGDALEVAEVVGANDVGGGCEGLALVAHGLERGDRSSAPGTMAASTGA